MDYYRSQRDRGAEARWAARHQDEIVALARRLLAIPDLQQRADRSTNAASVNARAAELAERAGTPLPALVRMPWPGLLAECLKDSTDAAEKKQMHMLFGLIRHAVDPNYIDLSDHDDIVGDVRQLYRDAGPPSLASAMSSGRAGRRSAPAAEQRRTGAMASAQRGGCNGEPQRGPVVPWHHGSSAVRRDVKGMSRPVVGQLRTQRY
ncbi:hypothetical protein ACGFWI_38405 [Streptomyces sp. NPDC048434]|uniref:hypothetical protein n=1 Tax=Streptomyces sp. NPDC048434 TaxID=3365549 RepID=UPI00371F1F2D